MRVGAPDYMRGANHSVPQQACNSVAVVFAMMYSSDRPFSKLMAKWYQVVLLGLGQLSARGVVLVQALTSPTLAVASGSLAEAATVPAPLQVRAEETWYGVHRHW